jgi:hypothetical protein
MKLMYQKIKRKLDSLAPQLRFIILLVFLTFFFIFWYFWLWQGQVSNRDGANKKLQEMEKEAKVLQVELTTYQKKAALQSAQVKTGDVVPNIGSQIVSGELLSKQGVAQVLEKFLIAKKGLSLLKLENLPVKRIEIPDVKDPKIKNFFYEHSFLISWQGDFFTNVEYLRDLEHSGWQFFWDKLEYKVKKYPLAEVVLQLHILSDREKWGG